MVSERGQAYTLEGFVGAMIVLTAMLFALQSVVLTPTTAGTVDQSVKTQLGTQANDLLRTAGSDGTLDDMILYWNASGGFAYASSTETGYGSLPPCAPARSPDTVCDSFGQATNATFTERGFVYNLYVRYRTAPDPTETVTRRVVYRGVPSSNAVTATYTVVLYDDMTLTAPEDAGGANLGSLAENEFYAPDVDPGPVYNVVEVRMVVW
ncbi:DUF7288 family protein [Halomicrococcus gelatinilyticus]|uniref:DUF7288 family protein n=1 Tax=Halomicrococcus gelatinilyticus TaxID=1702103 RepID=UPI002E14C16B